MNSEQNERRYTDQEVALVLRRAAEIEERHDSERAGRGLTQRELEAIAREAGFGVGAIQQALVELGSSRRFRDVAYLGPSPIVKRLHAVPGELAHQQLPPLIQVIEDRVATAGTVTEALGSVRWTSVAGPHHFAPVTQVTFTPADGETRIHVTQRFDNRVRRVVHLLPSIWGGMAGVVWAAGAAMSIVPAVITVAGVAALGFGIGRNVWRSMATRSGRRVEKLAAELAGEAKRMSRDISRPPA